MTDEAYTLSQTNRDRKITARSAAHRVNGSKSKRCTLPSDSLSPSQIKKLSGPVITYDMDRPHTWEEIKDWPDDLLREYLLKILDIGPSNDDLGKMLDYSPCHLFKPLSKAGIHRGRGRGRRQTPEQAAAWERFISDTTQDTAEEIPPQIEAEEPTPTIAPVSYVSSITLDMHDKGLSDLVKILLADPMIQKLGDHCHITITLEKENQP